jgi:hypothetical protein
MAVHPRLVMAALFLALALGREPGVAGETRWRVGDGVDRPGHGC